MIKRILFLLCIIPSSIFAQQYDSYVNPFIGTGGHGHTFPGATAPFGFCQLSPDTRIDGSWDGCGGYHYSDSVIYGFSHTHLSGTGVSDYGDILLMPVTTKMRLDNYDYKSRFSHKNEKATAGYYQVFLDQPQVNVELTTSRRCGFHKYSYPKKSEIYVVLDLAHRDELLESRMDMVDKHTIRGYRFSKAWAVQQKVFFEIKFEQEIERIMYEPIEMGSKTQAISLQQSPRALIKLKPPKVVASISESQTIKIKVGISGVDMFGAKNNLKTEIPHWDFSKTKKWVQNEWNEELSKIQVSDNNDNYRHAKYALPTLKKMNALDSTKDKMTIFYTALYHCMIAPNIYSDVDNRYRGRDDKIHSTAGKFDYYTVFSLWDTYRALHPLLTIIDKKRTNDFINTFIKQYEQGGRLPVWELSSNETNCMIGYHAVSVIWDAYNKGIRDYDAEMAFVAMKSIATENTMALKSYMRFGYVRAEDDAESVSKTLEYAYNDWCIAQMAKSLGKEEDSKYFEKRSHNWINVYDPTTGFMRARKNSTLIQPFSPYLVDNNFTEANSWQYSFYVPHDLEGLVHTLGGAAQTEKKLNELFSASEKTEGRTQSDITGLIGQYAHGNEPSHHIAYLYDFLGNHLSSKKIRDNIVSNFYKNSPNGLIGNEDCGQMSAWYVLNALGYYPVCPGFRANSYKGNGIVNSPNQYFIAEFDKIRIKNHEGMRFNINREEVALKDIDSTQLNTYFDYFNYSKVVPNVIYGSNYLKYKKNFYKKNHFYGLSSPNPFIQSAKSPFRKEVSLDLNSANKKADIYYSIKGSGYKKYIKPISITDNTKIKFYSRYYSLKSPSQVAKFTKLPNDREVFLKSKYSKTYHAGGPMGLVDGIHGTTNWRAGEWQGYQGQDFEAVIKYIDGEEINTISANFLQDQRAWIFYPTEVSFYESADSINWNLIETTSLAKKKKRDDDNVSSFNVKTSNRINGSTTVHYYKIVARNYGNLPNWHPGAGNPAYIFIDEIVLK